MMSLVEYCPSLIVLLSFHVWFQSISSIAFHHFIILAESLRSYKINLLLGCYHYLMLECCAAHWSPYFTSLLLFDFSVAIHKSWIICYWRYTSKKFWFPKPFNYLLKHICSLCRQLWTWCSVPSIFFLKMCLFVSSLYNSEHDVCLVLFRATLYKCSFYLLWVTSIWITLSLQICLLLSIFNTCLN